MRFWLSGVLPVVILCAGCGTTKWTDTSRTATEQLLISDSMDRVVSRIDFRTPLADKTVYLDDTPAKGVTDSAYLVSALRQHLLASGAILKEKREDADYIVEVRAGAVGTDHHDVLFGVPALSIPTVLPMAGVPSQIPELPLVKKTEQRAVAKISLFVYNRHTGRPLWQSGAVPEEARAKAIWVFGAGPFQRGTIYRGTNLPGVADRIPLIDLDKGHEEENRRVSVADEASFVEPKDKDKAGEAAKGVAQDGKPAPANGPSGVVQAGHTAPNAPQGSPAPPAPAASPPPSTPTAAGPPANPATPAPTQPPTPNPATAGPPGGPVASSPPPPPGPQIPERTPVRAVIGASAPMSAPFPANDLSAPLPPDLSWPEPRSSPFYRAIERPSPTGVLRLPPASMFEDRVGPAMSPFAE